MSPKRHPKAAAQRGYTVVELMMALAVFAIGVSGIIAMQKITLASNRHAKNLAVATSIAQAWQEVLAADAAQWNHPSARIGSSDLANDTFWLKTVEGQPNVWVRPPWETTMNFGPGFDALGNPTNVEANAVFCTHVRFNWLYANQPGSGLIRAEVRVFWLRDIRGGSQDNKPICSDQVLPTKVEQNRHRYHFVYHTTSVRKQTAL